MSEKAHLAVSNTVAKLQVPLTDVSNAISAEVDSSRQIVNAMNEWINQNGASYLVSLVIAILLLIIGPFIINLLTRMTHQTLTRSGKVNPLLEGLLCNIVHKSGWLVLIIMVAQRIGINVAPMIAGLGITGIILGFAFQESLSNLAAGMMIAINQPFKVGDFISAGGKDGKVLALNIVATTLATSDNRKVVVPNKLVWGSPITNFTDTDRRRVEVKVAISYDSDWKVARQVALDVARAHPMIMSEPAPVAEISSMDDSGATLVLRGWATPANYWRAYFDMVMELKTSFLQHNITIPYPQMDITLKQNPPSTHQD